MLIDSEWGEIEYGVPKSGSFSLFGFGVKDPWDDCEDDDDEDWEDEEWQTKL